MSDIEKRIAEIIQDHDANWPWDVAAAIVAELGLTLEEDITFAMEPVERYVTAWKPQS